MQFPAAFKAQLIADSLNSVYVVQECCYKACKLHDVHSTKEQTFHFPDTIEAQKLVAEVIQEQSARYSSFVTNFAAGFGETQLEMYKWLLYPVLTSSIEELTAGATYRQIPPGLKANTPKEVVSIQEISRRRYSRCQHSGQRTLSPSFSITTAAICT